MSKFSHPVRWTVCVMAVIKNGNGFSAKKAALLCVKPTKVRTSQLKGSVKIMTKTAPAVRGKPRLVFKDVGWKGHSSPSRLLLPSLYRSRRLESRWWPGPTRCDTPTRLPLAVSPPSPNLTALDGASQQQHFVVGVMLFFRCQGVIASGNSVGLTLRICRKKKKKNPKPQTVSFTFQMCSILLSSPWYLGRAAPYTMWFNILFSICRSTFPWLNFILYSACSG